MTINDLLSNISVDSVLDFALTVLGILCALYVKDRQRREKIDRLLAQLRTAAKDVVQSFEQTTVPKAKAEMGTARLTNEKAEQIKTSAVTSVVEMVDPAGSSVLAERLGMSEAKLAAMVDHFVESAVFESKSRPAA